jgi:hypothetical protein
LGLLGGNHVFFQLTFFVIMIVYSNLSRKKCTT